jgi:glycerol-3-phosphate dehydrogenase
LPAIRAICQPELGWDDAKWVEEEGKYIQLWNDHYGRPAGPVPDWKSMLAEAHKQARQVKPLRRRKAVSRLAVTGALLSSGALLLVVLWKKRRSQMA